MDRIKEHFESEARIYDETIIKLCPHYDQMIEALTDSIHFDRDKAIRVIDLGCGTGTISKRISELFPNSELVCLDIASNMLDIAKYKLSDHPKIEFLIGDFYSFEFGGKFDLAVSSLALHHLVSDDDKKAFYSKIFNALNDSGQFLNADLVLASTDSQQKVNIRHWIEFMSKSVSMEEILNKWIPNYEAEDRPAKLSDHLKWLEETGFKTVDVIWKYYNFSVWGGIK